MTSVFEAAYAPPGYLVFLRGSTLMAQPFDATRLELAGDGAPVAEGVLGIPGSNRASLSVSQTGVLAYANASLLDSQLVWFDRSGQSLGVVGPPDLFSNERPQLSPDGTRMVIGRDFSGGDADIWAFDLRSGARSRLTLSRGGDRAGIWSADGRKIVFQSGNQPTRLMAKDVDPVGPEAALADLAPGTAGLYDLSRDGQYAIYLATGPSGRSRDLWVSPLTGDRKPRVFVHSDTGLAVQAQFSPNGRWVAYTSTESGRDEVYVASFPTPSVKRQISADGGVQPRWRRDGAELFYIST
ncbi:MAG: TolB family protein, partial [Vicinamibacterales bacterium]